MLEVRELDAAYGDTQVLWGVSLDVQPGEVVALVGSNGAGKTTLLSTISALMRPRAGSIWFEGERISDASAADVVARGLVHVPEGRRLFPALSVRENLMLGAFKRKDAAAVRADYDRVLGLFPILAERQSQLAGKLSGGEQQMCAIGRALMSKPKLLLMDEPSAGLAPVVVQQVFELVRRIRKEGFTVLIVEQNVQQVLKLVDRAYLLEVGAIRMSGAAAELRQHDFIRKAYIGV